MTDSMSQYCPNCEAQAAEIERLTGCLTKANAQAEHFEREWYLRGDEIERLRGHLEVWIFHNQRAMGQKSDDARAYAKAWLFRNANGEEPE